MNLESEQTISLTIFMTTFPIPTSKQITIRQQGPNSNNSSVIIPFDHRQTRTTAINSRVRWCNEMAKTCSLLSLHERLGKSTSSHTFGEKSAVKSVVAPRSVSPNRAPSIEHTSLGWGRREGLRNKATTTKKARWWKGNRKKSKSLFFWVLKS